jgi:predicted ATP-binding protein involved in virulence
MYVKNIELKNFGQFEKANFKFTYPGINVIIANNGQGKSTILDSLAVVLGTWLLGIKGVDSRHIRDNEARKDFHTLNTEYNPVVIKANCEIYEKNYSLIRRKNTEKGKTTYIEAKDIKELAESTLETNEKHLPLIAYYGTGRRWLEPKESRNKKYFDISRPDGYRYSVDPRVNIKFFTQWFQRNTKDPRVEMIKNALKNCLENCEDLYFDTSYDMLMVKFTDNLIPFNHLSDGQKTLLAMIADMTFKIITLNPNYQDSTALERTTGCVLIDEIDLHLHPKWQREVLDNLSSTFPKIQFIVTTHSPFIIQSIDNNDTLIRLNDNQEKNFANLSIEEIAETLMNIKMTQRSKKFVDMFDTALKYYKLLDKANSENITTKELQKIKEKLDVLMIPFSNNPAHAAFYHYLEAKKISKNIWA